MTGRPGTTPRAWSPGALVHAVVASLVASLAACAVGAAGDGSPMAPGSEPSEVAGVVPGAVPTRAAPVLARAVLGPGPPGATALQLSIGSVVNPARTPVSLAVSIVEAGAAPRVHAVGVVSLFPSDQPGRFVLRLPSSWRPPRGDSDAAVPPASVVLSVVGVAPAQLALGEVEARLMAEPR